MVRTRTTEIAAALAFVAVASLATGCSAEGDVASLDQSQTGGFDELLSDPVIFVHGCPPPGATNEMVANLVFGPMLEHYRSQGYPESYLALFVHSGAACDSTITEANELADLIERVLDETGAWQVDIVAHSMGAFTTRLLLAYDWHSVVNDFISIGGSNHGTLAGEQGADLQKMFGAPAYEGMKEMFPPYACLHQTSGGAFDVQAVVNGCLTATGRTAYVDETPDSSHVDYLSIRNSIDEEIVPSESGCLNQHFQNDCSDDINVQVTVPPAPGPGPCGPDGCPAHVAILFDPGVTQAVFDHITDDD
jgi:pimeloyl-ACP methyl ester carboxylesterase